MSCPTYLIGLKISREVVYMLWKSVTCYVSAIITFTEENMLVSIVQNNLFSWQHDASMYFWPIPYPPKMSVSLDQWQHPITLSPGEMEVILSFFVIPSSISKTLTTLSSPLQGLGGKVIPLFQHHLWCTPMLTPNSSCSQNWAFLLFSHIQSELHMGKQEIPDGLTTSWIIKLLSI